MSDYRIACFMKDENPENKKIISALGDMFELTFSDDLSIGFNDYDLLIVSSSRKEMPGVFEEIGQLDWQGKPILLFSEYLDLQDKLNAFEVGISDCIFADINVEELSARCNRLVFDFVANKQLKDQVNMANQMAMQAMSNTSDLGVNIQYFIDSQECNSLNELGMRLLQSTQAYGLKCSLQIRSEIETRNMEQNGMEKTMESQLLTELHTMGRYYDFGKRTVMNYERISLLVKNMPTDNEERYGALKDNVFSLLQSANARVSALESLAEIEREKQLIEQLVHRTTGVLKQMEQDFLETSKLSANVVDSIAENIEEKIQFLGLHEDQESFFMDIMEKADKQIQKVFSDGLKNSSQFRKEIAILDVMFDKQHGVDMRLLSKFLNQ
jgi:hypothetical protein